LIKVANEPNMHTRFTTKWLSCHVVVTVGTANQHNIHRCG